MWFLYGVARHVQGRIWDDPSESGISTEEITRLADVLMADKKAVASIKRYSARNLYSFGSRDDDRQMGSIKTRAFKVTAEFLKTRGN